MGRGPGTPSASPCAPPDSRAKELGSWFVISDRETGFGSKDPKKFRRWITARPTSSGLLSYPRTVSRKVGFPHKQHIACHSNRCKLNKDAFVKLHDPWKIDCALFVRSAYSCKEGERLMLAVARSAARIHAET